MNTSKLTITYETKKGEFGGKLVALFNPSQLRFAWTAVWQPQHSVIKVRKGEAFKAGTTVFQNAGPETLTLALFFDTYAASGGAAAGGTLAGVDELRPAGKGTALGLAPSPEPEPKSVADLTDQLMNLTRFVKDLERPPVCKLSWGGKELLRGVLQSATRTYVLFWPNGTPARATVDCTFMRADGDVVTQKEVTKALEKTYIVKPGDTLEKIAHHELDDRKKWRLIAEENGLVNPRKLVPGTELVIPKAKA